MFQRKLSIYRKINITGDVVIAFLSFVVAVGASSYFQTGALGAQSILSKFLGVALIVSVLWPVLLNVNGIYPTSRLRSFFQVVQIISKSSLQGALILIAILFVFRYQVLSTQMLAFFVILVTAMFCVKEGIVMFLLGKLRSSGKNLRNVLIVGTADTACTLLWKIERDRTLGLNTLGILAPKEAMLGSEHGGLAVLGSLEDIEKVLHEHPIDHVIITIDKGNYKEVENVITRCEDEGVEIWIMASIFDIKRSRIDVEELFDMPVFVFQTTPRFSWGFVFKGFFDYVGAALVGILTLPIIIIAAFLIKISSRGPVFFKQTRSGLQGREFTLYKLRTMYEGMNISKEQLTAENIMKGPVFKMFNDPRGTPLGKFLRKTSIDELPQIWNVLRGDMSMVGPRPPLPEEVNQYQRWQRRRLSMKPGITGLWQVSGRSNITDFEEWVRLDLEYIDNWSILLDLKIVLRTFYVVLFGFGAH